MSDSPSSLVVRSFPSDAHEALRTQARQRGLSLQQHLTDILIAAARNRTKPTGVTEAEMRAHVNGIVREVAVRIGAISASDAPIYSTHEAREAVSFKSGEIYIAMQQHINAYQAWWSHQRLTVDTGQESNPQYESEQRRLSEQSEQTKSLLLKAVRAAESERHAALFRESCLREKFDEEHVEAILVVAEAISGKGRAILQAPGKDGWVITVGAMDRSDELGYANTFDPPSPYDDTFVRNPETAAKIFVDAVGASAARRALRKKGL